jgi:hypothetical protein
VRGKIGPRQKIVDSAVGMTVSNFGDDVRQIVLRIDGMSLQVLIRSSMFCAANFALEYTATFG